jgi:hypothetical protein
MIAYMFEKFQQEAAAARSLAGRERAKHTKIALHGHTTPLPGARVPKNHSAAMLCGKAHGKEKWKQVLTLEGFNGWCQGVRSQ